jgi:adenylate cyclase
MGETRKIAAILAADVVGFSRLTSVDEDRTLARLRALRSDLIDPTIAVHNGRVIKRTGDGILVEFRSVVDAVRCAIEFQSGMIERNAGLPADRRIVFRVGIHLGDVVEERDGDLMGDGVNIAARLEGIAKPGGICLSEDAYRQVRSRLDLEVSDLGPTELKNIAEPVRVYSLDVGGAATSKLARAVEPGPAAPAAAPPRSRRWRLALAAAVLLALVATGAFYLFVSRPSTPAVASRTPPVAAAHLSIVVLPFTNISNDPAQDYFADGITENLTTDLSRIRNSFVIARNTAFTFKGKNIDAREIGRELGVRYALEGSVQRDEGRVRVTAQLIDTETGAHLWADRFEEDVADLFKLQDRIVARLINSLGYELIKAEAEKGARSKSPDLVDLTMRGWALAWQTTQAPEKANCDSALGFFKQALAIDPDDADALTGEAVIYLIEYSFDWGAPGADYDSLILRSANRAITLAPDNVQAYLVKSEYLSFSHRADEGLGVADAGLVMNPNNAHLFAARGFAEIALGRFEQAKTDFQPAMRLSPRDPAIAQWHVSLGLAELGLGHFDAAVEAFTRSINFGNRTFIPYGCLAAAYALDGKADSAKSALGDARRLNPKLSVKQMMSIASEIPNLRDGLRKAGLPEE